MNDLINKLFDSFETKSKNPKEMFNDFLYHVFLSFESMIKSKKHKRKSNKYIQMRQKIINYLISSDTKLENRLNYSKPLRRINKANNYSRGVVISSYISLIYTLSVKSHYNYVPRFYN
jgi:hypothetical protein